MTYLFNNNIELGNSSQVDGLDRLRTSSPRSIFDSTLKNNSEEFLWDTKTTGAGIAEYITRESVVHLDVTTTGDSVIRQTREYFQYQSGKSHIAMFAGNFHSEEVGDTSKRIGFLDNNNGVFFQYDNTMGLTLRLRTDITGVVEEFPIPQSFWNQDTLDGSGPSGITIDTTMMQLFFIDFAWTGIGRIRLGVVLGGRIHYCHEFESANTRTTNFLGAPSLPCRYEITSNGGAGTLKQQAVSVMIEGDFGFRGITRSVNTGTTAITVSNRRPVLSIRLKPEYTRAMIRPVSVSAIQNSNNNMLYYEVLMRPDTLNATNWLSSNSSTIAEYNTDATTVTGGIIVTSGYLPPRMSVPASAIIDTIIPIVSDIDGNRDIFTLVLHGIDGNVASFGAIDFKEIY